MRAALRHTALGLALGFLPFASVLAGKMWAWQSLLVGLIGGLALTPWAVASCLREPAPTAPTPARPRGKRRPEPPPDEPVAAAPRGPDAVDWALIAFLVWQAISWFISVYHFATGMYLARLLACAVVFWLLRYGLWPRRTEPADGDTPRLWRLALWSVVLGGVLMSVIGLREYVRTVHFLGAADWRVFGPMVNPNAAAGYLLVTLFPAAALLLGSQSRAVAVGAPASSRPDVPDRPRYPEIAALFALLLMAATLLLTGSKAAFAALLVGIVLFGLVGLAGNRRAQATVLALALLMVVVAFLLPPIRVRLLNAFGMQKHSTVFRLYTWQATLHMIQARPLLGFGAGTFEHVFPRFALAGFTRAAHQSFLQLAAETGLPGLALAMAWGGLVGARLLRVARSTQPLVKLAAAAALAGLAASALQEVFDYPWYIPGVAYSFFALAGLALAAPSALAERQLGSGASPRPANRRLAWRAAVVAGLVLTLWSGKNLIAEGIGARGDAEAAAMACAAASATYERALAWNPGQAHLAAQMARCEEALAAGGDEQALARAVQARLRAVALQPTEPQNYLGLARLYAMAGRMDDALAAARQALEVYPNYPRGLADLIQLQEQAGQHAAALDTCRRLIALQDSPVGRYPPVEGVVETAYARAWLLLAAEAARSGRTDEALTDYSHATVILSGAIGAQLETRDAAGGEVPGLGRLNEDTAAAEEVLAGLRRISTPLSLMRQAQLALALRRADEARALLGRLASGDIPARNAADRLAAVWGMLRLAQELEQDEPERAAQLARQAVAPPPPPGSGELTRLGWLPDDVRDLTRLQQWAQGRTNGSPPEDGAPPTQEGQDG